MPARFLGWVMAKAAFRQRDVTRLIKGAVAAGLGMGTFGIQLIDGKPTLIPMAASPVSARERQDGVGDVLLDDELEAWRAGHGQG
ncbi:MAG: hypothetical protein Q8L66_13930 [Caulobacter sp.]|nr:hypothetical protein [Caulobacter sp.]